MIAAVAIWHWRHCIVSEFVDGHRAVSEFRRRDRSVDQLHRGDAHVHQMLRRDGILERRSRRSTHLIVVRPTATVSELCSIAPTASRASSLVYRSGDISTGRDDPSRILLVHEARRRAAGPVGNEQREIARLRESAPGRRDRSEPQTRLECHLHHHQGSVDDHRPVHPDGNDSDGLKVSRDPPGRARRDVNRHTSV